MTRGFSVTIHLVDGNPDGLWLVRKRNSIGLAIRASRATWNSVRIRDELQSTGVYLLTGEDEDGPVVYVGEADVLARRIGQHESTREFWDTVTCFTATDDSLNKAHARYLESRLLTILKSAGHRLLNGTGSAGARLTAAEVDDVETFLDEILLLLPIVGISLGAAAPKVNLEETTGDLRCTAFESDAKGTYGPQGLTVLKGSICASDRPSFAKSPYRTLRMRLLENEVLEPHDSGYIFLQDYSFKSPSAAAAVVGGKSFNGWESWVNGEGKTLHELERAKS